MIVRRMSVKEREEFVWQWEIVKHFPGILCKQLLWPDGPYWLGWAEIETAAEYLDIQLRDHDKSRCLTPVGQPHSMRDILDRMEVNKWTFDRLASDDLSNTDASRDKQWFRRCIELDATFDPHLLGIITIHPREGFKDLAVQDAVYDAKHHEIYEGLHRSLILAKKTRENSASWKPLRVLYLYPDRETEPVAKDPGGNAS